MKPMLRVMADDPDIRLSLLVTDQHVNPKFGSTIVEIERDFTVAAAVDMEQVDGSPLGRSRALGVCLTKMSDVLGQLKPDIIVLYGDRGEVLVTALAAVTQSIPIAHLQGGDVSGNVDEIMRHAITKLSHIHFPSTAASGQRVLQLGEESWRVHVVGDNHVDSIVAGDYTDAQTVRTKFAVPAGESPIVVLLHPETTRERDGYRDMCVLLDAVLSEMRRTFVVYPCSDSGYEGIVRAIEEYAGAPGLSVHKNIDAPDFWGILAIAGAMVGNSSAGLIETPYFKIPAINIGDRQRDREHGSNVIHSEYTPNALRKALATALRDDDFRHSVVNCRTPFGDGFAYRRIVDQLKSVVLDERFVNKRLSF